MIKGRAMGGHLKLLFLVASMLAVAMAGCTIPGLSSEEDDPGSYLPISPTPTITPVPTPSPTPSPTPVPTATPTIAAHSTVVAPAGGNYSQTYTWKYKGVDWVFNAIVQKAKYDLFKAKPHSHDLSFASYSLAGEDRDLIGSVVAQLGQAGAGYGFTRYDDAMNLITFVQSIPYVDDHPAGSPRYPLETLADAQGDCKDKSVLAAALLQARGFDVALLSYSGSPGHVALGIGLDASGTSFSSGDARYFYVEMTTPGWAVGEVPDELKGVVPSIIPVVKNPSLLVSVTATATGTTANLVDYRVQYTVTNQGPGTAKHILLRVRAMALGHGYNVIWDPERIIELNDLAEGRTINGDILVMIPAGEPTRFVGIVSAENADPAQASTPEFVSGT
jgi:hypothetical protein